MTTTSVPPDQPALKRRALSGFIWAYGSFFGNRVLTFTATLVLARLLVPSEFGVVAFTLAILSYVENVADLGLGSALVQRADADEPATISTAFWAGLAVALALTTLCFVSAPYVAELGPSGSVAAMFRVLSLQFVIAALANPQQLLLQRHLKFRRLVVPVWAGAFVKAATSIVLAVMGYGAWSLVWGQLAGTAATTLVLWWMSPWRPHLQVIGRRLREMLKFGTGVAVVGIVGEAVNDADYIIVGTRLGSAALGLYLLAFRIPELVIASGFRVANTVFFPFYSRLREHAGEVGDDELRRGYVRTLRFGALVALPAGLTMAALSEPIVLTLYGDRWRASVAPLAGIAIWAAMSSLTTLPGALFKAVGRSWLLTANSVLELVLIIPTLWFAAGHGITTVAIAHAVVKITFFCILTFIVRKVLGVPLTTSYVSLFPGLVVGATTALAAFGVAHVFASIPLVALLCGLVAAGAIYAIALRLVSPGAFHAFASSGKRGAQRVLGRRRFGTSSAVGTP
jgi:polysaccharide transporter, PST family